MMPLFVDCQKLEWDGEILIDAVYRQADDSTWTPKAISEAEYQQAVEAIQRRAHQIADVKWSPVGAVPRNGGITYPAGKSVSGIPYSSVKELDKFVGHEVSFYTFLTAVQNPKSVLYTENVSHSPYHGVNCAAYYGTVCSISVNYALGLDAPYESSMYAKLPFFEKVANQSPEAVKVGDVLWKKGHVVMVEDVNNSDGSVESVSILESNGGGTSIRKYSLAEFSNRWNSSSWVLYRYLDFARVIEQDDIQFLSSLDQDNYTVSLNAPLCPSRGDRACYREGEDVILNVLGKFEEAVYIRRDSRLVYKFYCESDDLKLTGLTAGIYEVSLSDGQTICSFEVVQTEVNVRKVSNGMAIDYSSSNGIPENVILCTATGTRKYIHVFTDEERESGRIIIPYTYGAECLKVFFRGDYGRVSNELIGIQ